jgi:small subunit ribosomal protein S6
MHNYEVVTIIHPDLDEAAVEALIEKISGWITEAGGSIEKVDKWGKRRMAYQIRKQREGQYVLFQTQMPTTLITELERNLQLQEPVMRYMVTSIE